LFATFVVISKCLSVIVMPYFISVHYPVMTSAFDHLRAFSTEQSGPKSLLLLNQSIYVNY